MFCLQDIQPSSGALPTSSSMGTGVPSLEVKWPDYEVVHSPPFHAEVNNECVYFSFMPSWHGQVHLYFYFLLKRKIASWSKHHTGWGVGVRACICVCVTLCILELFTTVLS